MKQLRDEGCAKTSRDVNPWNSLSSTILEAYQQLISTPCSIDAFRILWCVALHDDGAFVMACMEKRLIGTERLVAIELTAKANMSDTPPKIVNCYYHRSNDFQRCPKLDAAVIGTREGGKLLVNLHSDNRDRFRCSRLHAMFDRYNAVIDAEIAEQSGKAFMLGRDFTEVRNGKSQRAYIRNRYSVGTSVMLDNHFSAYTTIHH
jgi:hypothetical protein